MHIHNIPVDQRALSITSAAEVQSAQASRRSAELRERFRAAQASASEDEATLEVLRVAEVQESNEQGGQAEEEDARAAGAYALTPPPEPKSSDTTPAAGDPAADNEAPPDEGGADEGGAVSMWG
jgi:hypothetical protein